MYLSSKNAQVTLMLCLSLVAAHFAQAEPVKSGLATKSTSGSALPPVVASSGIGSQEIRAQVLAKRYTTLASEMGANVTHIYAPEGTRFSTGAALASLDCDVQEAQRQKAKAEYTAAKQSLIANQRLAELNATGMIEADMAKGAFERAEAEVKTLDAQISRCVIRAPFPGVVAEQRVRERQYVQPGQAMFDIIDDSAFEVEFLVPSTWIARLKIGSPINVAVDEIAQVYEARISRLSNKVDPASQSIKITAQIYPQGKKQGLRAGMSGRVSFKK